MILAVHLNDAAGRTAYLAAFHAAQAFIFQRTGKVLKSHKGRAHRILASDQG